MKEAKPMTKEEREEIERHLSTGGYVFAAIRIVPLVWKRDRMDGFLTGFAFISAVILLLHGMGLVR